MIKSFSILLGILLVLVLPGCGSPSTPNPQSSTNTGNTNTPVAPEGTPFPTDYPKDIPNYPNATTLFALKDAQPGHYSISQETTDAIPTITSWMDTFFKEAGFQKTITNGDENLMLVDYEKGSIRLHLQLARRTEMNTTQILTNRLVITP
jgi:hypothetical protein